MAKARKRKRKTVNASETAEMLGVHTSTVIGWVHRGCPVVSKERVGRKTLWMFDMAAVKEWRKQDLARRDEPRTGITAPMSLPNGLMSKEEKGRFRQIIEGLVRPTDE